jgi:beta-glucanase (GH16 family)
MSDHAIRVIRGILLLWLVLPAGMAQTTSGWKLVWSDEFNGPAGAPPNPANWNYDLGGGGWGNGEAEVYTNSPNNVFQDGKGSLVIRAIRDSSGNFTSARLQTGAPGASTQTTDLSWQYGRIEARIKLPFGLGVWPAFWILGENIDLVGWPQSGEVDIMENFGTYDNNVSVNNGTAHGPGYSGADGISRAYTLPFGEKVADDYHVYAIEWSHNSIVWYVDGASYHTVTPSSIPEGDQWVFNAPFFILLNLAIGGPDTFLGTPNPKAPFPNQDMLVDYVRVYQSRSISSTTPVITPGSVMNAASLLGTTAPGQSGHFVRRKPGGRDALWRSGSVRQFPQFDRRRFGHRQRQERATDDGVPQTDHFPAPLGDRSRGCCEGAGHSEQGRQQCRGDHHCRHHGSFGVPERSYERRGEVEWGWM